MAYRLNSHTERVNFPGDPSGSTFLTIRLGGQLAGVRYREMIDAEVAAKGYKSADGKDAEEAIPFDRREELLRRATCGTWILGYGGWETEDGRPLDRVSGPVEDEVWEILRDPAVGNWFFGTVCVSFADKVAASFKAAEGEFAPQPVGIGSGAEASAN